MKISSKLRVLFVATLVVFSGLTITLLREVRSISASYDSLLQGPVSQAQTARVIQVDFKKQVQEWKDILLRGHNPEDLAKYTKQFHDKEAQVRAQAQALAGAVEGPVARQLLDDFIAAHGQLGEKYRASYDVFVSGKFDSRAADKMVRGQDRVPTDLFDTVVEQLNAQVVASVTTAQADVVRRRNVALTLAVLLLGLVSLAGFIVVRGILMRLGQLKAVSDRLALADVTGLVIDISGHDEIGEFGYSLKGVAAAIEELSTLAAKAA